MYVPKCHAPKRSMEDKITMKDILYYVESKSGAESEEIY